MILRPVSPVSPCGPPITKRPVGLIRYCVSFEIMFFGSTGLTISSTTASVSGSWEMSSRCWVEITTVSMWWGLPST